jgi:hypothetical protein
MRSALAFVVLAWLAMPATAQEKSRVVEGCIAAVSFATMNPTVEPIMTQDFGELDPPSARISIEMPGAPVSPITVECKFTSSESPLGIVDICFHQADLCLSEEPPRRFEEIKLLLERAGF